MNIRNILAILLLITMSSASAFANERFEEGKNCVSYTVTETVMFLFDRQVVGVNCDVRVEFDGSDNAYRFNAMAPIDKFSTGNSTRDNKVRQILREDILPDLSVTTEWKSIAEWKQLLEQEHAYDHNGYLVLAGQASELPHFITRNSLAGVKFSSGTANFKFSDFKLIPPKVFGGLWVSVHEEIRLDFRFYKDRINGLDKLN